MQTSQSVPAAPGIILWIALLGIGICWGSTQLFSKLIVNAGHHPMGITFLTVAMGAPIVTALLLLGGRRLPLSRRHLIFYAVCGLTGTAFPNYLGYTAMRELPVGIVSIVMASVPLVTFMGAVAFRLERPEFVRVAGLLCGAVAVLFLVVPETSLPESVNPLYVAVSLLVVLSYSVENIYIAKSQPADCNALQTMCGLSWAAFLMILPATAISGTWMELSRFGTAELSLVAMTLCHIAAYCGFIWLIGQAGPVFAAQVGYVVTISGVFLGMAVLGERHSGWVWVSLVVMFAGLALVRPRR